MSSCTKRSLPSKLAGGKEGPKMLSARIETVGSSALPIKLGACRRRMAGNLCRRSATSPPVDARNEGYITAYGAGETSRAKVEWHLPSSGGACVSEASLARWARLSLTTDIKPISTWIISY